MTTPYYDDDLEKIKAEIDAAELFLRDTYPQSDRETEIIGKARLISTRVGYIYDKLITTQEFAKRQAKENMKKATT